jgi:hypothetical protein
MYVAFLPVLSADASRLNRLENEKFPFLTER